MPAGTFAEEEDENAGEDDEELAEAGSWPPQGGAECRAASACEMLKRKKPLPMRPLCY